MGGRVVHLCSRCLAETNEVSRVAELREALEQAARICVRRSCTWSKDDDARSQDYREGVEDAASQLAKSIRRIIASLQPAKGGERHQSDDGWLPCGCRRAYVPSGHDCREVSGEDGP